MPRVKLDYGSDGLWADLPGDRTVVVEPNYPPGLVEPEAELRRVLAEPIGTPPLAELSKSKGKIVVSVCDGTRPQPRPLMLQALFESMPTISPEQITILVATGTHRANTRRELEAMLGHDIVSTCRVVNHDARDMDMLQRLDDTPNGVPVWLNREWLDADFRITTGFIEPHFFAGFSGGPKMVAPGLAGLETTLVLHDADHVGHASAKWGIIEGNPIQEDIRSIVRDVGVDFAFDVTLNGQKEITAAFAGELFAEHAAGCAVSKREAMRPMKAPFDMVVTTNSGFPLDQNLYQAVKGMSAAANIVRQGGVILCAAECRDGIPDHGRFAELLKERDSPRELLQMVCEPGFLEPDQWQVQVQSMIQQRARVSVFSEGLSRDTLESAHLEKCEDIDSFVRKTLSELGGDASLCVLPHGPQTIAYVSD